MHWVFLETSWKYCLSYFLIILKVIICSNHHSIYLIGLSVYFVKLYFFCDTFSVGSWDFCWKHVVFVIAAYVLVSTFLSNYMLKDAKRIKIVSLLFSRPFKVLLYICKKLFWRWRSVCRKFGLKFYIFELVYCSCLYSGDNDIFTLYFGSFYHLFKSKIVVSAIDDIQV